MGNYLNKLSVVLFAMLSLISVSAVYGNGLQTDSLAYELQRSKVNRMLENRKSKFGEYDQSLQAKTGVFGIFKTKGDMQRSIDILKQIVITDNEILMETKKLLDFKDYEKAYYQRLADEYDNQRSAYMKTISKLQHENEKLREEVAQLQNEEHDSNMANYYALLVIMGLLGVVIWQYIKHRPKKVTKL